MLSDARIKEIAATPAATPGSYVHTVCRAIEAEVRKQDTELIRQMQAALETCITGCDYLTEVDSVIDAITAARARLEKT